LKQKKEYIDFIFEEILEKESMVALIHALEILSIKTVYVMREIKQKSDLEYEYQLPLSNGITFKKAYLFYDISLIPFFKNKNKEKDNYLILAYGGEITKNSLILEKNRGIDILINPISEKLSFDTSSANLAKENKLVIGFDLNLFRDKPYSSIKQARFIISLLVKNEIDMRFCSCARNVTDLIDPIIARSFLLNFKLNQETIQRMQMERIG